MSASQRKLAAAALLLVAAGILFGFGHAVAVRYNTLPVLQYRGQWTTAALATQHGSNEAIQAAGRNSYTYTRVVDAHTHVIKLATVLLILALIYPLVSLPEKRKRMLAIMFLAGNCVFPLGVLAEIYVRGRSAQVLAAAGAMLVIFAFAGLLWGLLQGSWRRASLQSRKESSRV